MMSIPKIERWNLPTAVTLNGVEYKYEPEYKNILKIIDNFSDNETMYIKQLTALAMFYNDFEVMPKTVYQSALQYLFNFIRMGEVETQKVENVVDWKKDYIPIITGINKNRNSDIRAADDLHWFTFMTEFSNIGEGLFHMIISIRRKKMRGIKLSDTEKEFYRENKEMVDLEVANMIPEEQLKIIEQYDAIEREREERERQLEETEVEYSEV